MLSVNSKTTLLILTNIFQRLFLESYHGQVVWTAFGNIPRAVQSELTYIKTEKHPYFATPYFVSIDHYFPLFFLPKTSYTVSSKTTGRAMAHHIVSNPPYRLNWVKRQTRYDFETLEIDINKYIHLLLYLTIIYCSHNHKWVSRGPIWPSQRPVGWL